MQYCRIFLRAVLDDFVRIQGRSGERVVHASVQIAEESCPICAVSLSRWPILILQTLALKFTLDEGHQCRREPPGLGSAEVRPFG